MTKEILDNLNCSEVVRCGKCKHYEGGVCQHENHKIKKGFGSHAFRMEPSEFCSDGERKETNE